MSVTQRCSSNSSPASSNSIRGYLLTSIPSQASSSNSSVPLITPPPRSPRPRPPGRADSPADWSQPRTAGWGRRPGYHSCSSRSPRPPSSSRSPRRPCNSRSPRRPYSSNRPGCRPPHRPPRPPCCTRSTSPPRRLAASSSRARLPYCSTSRTTSWGATSRHISYQNSCLPGCSECSLIFLPSAVCILSQFHLYCRSAIKLFIYILFSYLGSLVYIFNHLISVEMV